MRVLALAVCSFCVTVSAQIPGLPPGVTVGAAQIVLKPGVVTAKLPPGLRFVSAKDLLAQGPMADSQALLGGFAPKEPSGGDCFVTVAWLEDGHLAEADAQSLSADAVLAALRDEAESANAARRTAGRAEVQVVELVQSPRYDAKEKIITYAWRGRIGDAQRITLEARKMTRAGTLTCIGIGPEPEFAKVTAATYAVLADLSVAPGHRYEDATAADPKSKWALTKRVAAGVWDGLSVWQKVLVGVLAASGLLAVLRVVRRLFGGA